ncbi:MAG: SH3 domain-containing protein [Christensenellales bacterium]|jgi:uncharacterized protein YgiM (DUF1202 family)
MKRLLCAALVALLCASLFVPAAGASTIHAAIKTPYTSGCIHVRAGTGTRYKVLGYAYYGDAIEVLSTGNVWIKVRILSTGIEGYVNSYYVSEYIPVTSVKKWGSVAFGISKRAGGNGKLLVDRGTRLAVTGVLENDDKQTAIGHVGSWYEVQLIPTERTGNAYSLHLAEGLPARTTAMVNLRRGASPKAAIIASPDKGSNIAVLTLGEKWSKVRYRGRTGYMYNKYIELYDNAAEG